MNNQSPCGTKLTLNETYLWIDHICFRNVQSIPGSTATDTSLPWISHTAKC